MTIQELRKLLEEITYGEDNPYSKMQESLNETRIIVEPAIPNAGITVNNKIIEYYHLLKKINEDPFESTSLGKVCLFYMLELNKKRKYLQECITKSSEEILQIKHSNQTYENSLSFLQAVLLIIKYLLIKDFKDKNFKDGNEEINNLVELIIEYRDLDNEIYDINITRDIVKMIKTYSKATDLDVSETLTLFKQILEEGKLLNINFSKCDNLPRLKY